MAMPGVAGASFCDSTLSKSRITTPTASTESPFGPITRMRRRLPTGRTSVVAANRPPRLTSTVRATKVPRMSVIDSFTWTGFRREVRLSRGLELGWGMAAQVEFAIFDQNLEPVTGGSSTYPGAAPLSPVQAPCAGSARGGLVGGRRLPGRLAGGLTGRGRGPGLARPNAQ